MSDGDLFLGCAEYSVQDQRLQKHSFAPRGNNTDKSSSGQSKPKSKGNSLLPWYSNAPKTCCCCNCLVVIPHIKQFTLLTLTKIQFGPWDHLLLKEVFFLVLLFFFKPTSGSVFKWISRKRTNVTSNICGESILFASKPHVVQNWRTSFYSIESICRHILPLNVFVNGEMWLLLSIFPSFFVFLYLCYLQD